MGLFSDIFGSKKSTDTKSTTNGTSTTTPNVPDWIQNPIQDYTSKISDLGNSDPYSWVAPASDLQNQAFSGGSTLGSGSNGQYDDAMQMMARAANIPAPTYTAATGTASSLLNNLDSYMSPYRDQVVNSTLKDYDYSAGQQRAQDDLNLASSGAFGGSGAALAKSMTADNLARGRSTTESDLLNQMFNTGAGLSNQDAQRAQDMTTTNLNAQNTARQFDANSWNDALNRQLVAANNLATTAGANDANNRANLSLQDQLGGDQRAINQDQISAPISLLGTQTGLTEGLPLNMFNGSTTTGTQNMTGSSTMTSTPSVAQIAGQIAQMIAMSDVRLKTNIERVGTHPLGCGIYDFTYVWGGPRYRGVMAQELLNFMPEAVVELANGYLAVNYGALI